MTPFEEFITQDKYCLDEYTISRMEEAWNEALTQAINKCRDLCYKSGSVDTCIVCGQCSAWIEELQTTCKI